MPGFPKLLQLGPEVANSQDGVYVLCMTETTRDPPQARSLSLDPISKEAVVCTVRCVLM